MSAHNICFQEDGRKYHHILKNKKAHLGLGVQKTRLRKQAIDHGPHREKT